MCDYSLHAIRTRDAKVSDRLVVSRFEDSATVGFADERDCNLAVCLRPGTEVVFAQNARYYKGFLPWFKRSTNQKQARFRKIDENLASVHHDAFEFPDGQVIRLTDLVPGQQAMIVQLPYSSSEAFFRPRAQGVVSNTIEA
jgi:hypothetical protein